MNPYSPANISVQKASSRYADRFSETGFAFGLGSCLFAFVVFAIGKSTGSFPISTNSLLSDLCLGMICSGYFGFIFGLFLSIAGWLIGFTFDLFVSAGDEAGSEELVCCEHCERQIAKSTRICPRCMRPKSLNIDTY